MLSAALAIALAATPVSFESRFGINAHLPSANDLDDAQAAGFGWVRFDFNWFQIETDRGLYDFSAQDAAVDAAASRGLSVFATLAYTPQWAASNPSCIPDGPDATTRCQTQTIANVQDWTDFVTAIVSRYGDRVKVFGMWNEPNLGDFWQGTEAQYVAGVLVPGSAAVHAACADCLVAGPETSGLTASSRWNGASGTCAFGGCIRNGWELDLGDVLDDAGASIDIVTQHFYNSSVEAEAVGQLCDGQFFGATMTHDSLRGVLAAHGAASKPVWLTETGLEIGGSNTETAQAAFLPALLQARDQLADGSYGPSTNDPFTVAKIFLYDLKDGANDGWGLVRADGSHKPAFDSVSEYIAAHAATPTPAPTATPTPAGSPTPGPTPAITPGPGGSGSNGGGCDTGAAANPVVVAPLALLALAFLRRR